jgi:hypothetical protein
MKGDCTSPSYFAVLPNAHTPFTNQFNEGSYIENPGPLDSSLRWKGNQSLGIERRPGSKGWCAQA